MVDSIETQDYELKSLRVLTARNPDWSELAKDCVCFANARGGSILIGIEDQQTLPPDGQQIPTQTTLQRIEPHRLQALILEDLRHYPNSSIGEIRERIGPELVTSRIKRALEKLISDGEVTYEGEKRGRRYFLKP